LTGQHPEETVCVEEEEEKRRRGESEDCGLVCSTYSIGYRRRTKYGGAPAIFFSFFSSKSKT
jgi:hypothetical protein